MASPSVLVAVEASLQRVQVRAVGRTPQLRALPFPRTLVKVVSDCLGCCTEIPRTGWRMHRKLISHRSGGWRSRTRVPAWPDLDGSALRVAEAPGAPSERALTLLRRALPSRPNQLPRAPPLDAVSRGRNFRVDFGGTRTLRPQHVSDSAPSPRGGSEVEPREARIVLKVLIGEPASFNGASRGGRSLPGERTCVSC